MADGDRIGPGISKAYLKEIPSKISTFLLPWPFRQIQIDFNKVIETMPFFCQTISSFNTKMSLGGIVLWEITQMRCCSMIWGVLMGHSVMGYLYGPLYFLTGGTK